MTPPDVEMVCGRYYLPFGYDMPRTGRRILGKESGPKSRWVGEATDGEQAINLVETCRPDVVLMDARMPIIDGLEATRRIKKRWPEVKVIVLTVYAAYRSAAQAAGADAFVIKGAPPEELLEAILVPQEKEDDVQQSIPGATTGA